MAHKGLRRDKRIITSNRQRSTVPRALKLVINKKNPQQTVSSVFHDHRPSSFISVKSLEPFA
jgi:hypothetical protein